MPVRLLPVTEHASRVLLEAIVDYAGLFPPASVDMMDAVRNYAHYRAGGAGWMLGRFVCPASRLARFSEVADPLLPRDAGAVPWRLTAISSGDVPVDLLDISAFNERHRVCFEECGAFVDAYEVRVNSALDVATIDAAIPLDLVTYLEVTADNAQVLLPRIAATGRRAKLRTGGVTADAFPSADAIVSFLEHCIEHAIVAKATAGLHHTMCGAYRLTYDENAPSSRMFGYLNVFLAAALLAHGGEAAQAVRLVNESDPFTLTIEEEHVTWRSPSGPVVLDRALLQRVREQVLVSFGSCSFTEPVNEIRAMGWI